MVSMEAKKLIAIENDQQPVQDQEHLRRLEQRYAFDYRSAAGSLVSKLDASALETLVSSIEKEEYPQESFTDILLVHAKKLLETFGYTQNIIKSQSQKQIGKQYKSLESQLKETKAQLTYQNQRLATLNTYITSTSQQLTDLHEDMSLKSQDLEIFLEEIQDYQKVQQTSLDGGLDMYLHQAEFDYELQKGELQDMKSNIDLCLSIQKEYYMDKAQEVALKTLFEADTLVIESLQKKLHYELEKSKTGHPVKTLSANRAAVTKTYKLQNELVEKEKRLREQYNGVIRSMPSIPQMQKATTDKKGKLKPLRR